MVKLKVIELAKPSDAVLDMLMQYAGVSDAGQRTILAGCLTRAMDMVQKYADKALLAGRWRVVASDNNGEIPVYMGGTAEYVTDRHGAQIPFVQRDNKVIVGADEYVEVVFTTEVDHADMDILLPVVYQYATALYDGEDARVLYSILKEAL